MTSHPKFPKVWPVQDAKARFSEMLEASVREGPQIVTKRGVETAVLVPIEEWRRLNPKPRRTLKELLLAEEPRFDFELERIPFNRRPPLDFDD
jgi:prevent-host-death family protein